MASHPITIHLPETVYEQLRDRAERHRRSLEAGAVDVIVAVLLKERDHDIDSLVKEL